MFKGDINTNNLLHLGGFILFFSLDLVLKLWLGLFIRCLYFYIIIQVSSSYVILIDYLYLAVYKFQ